MFWQHSIFIFVNSLTYHSDNITTHTTHIHQETETTNESINIQHLQQMFLVLPWIFVKCSVLWRLVVYYYRRQQKNLKHTNLTKPHKFSLPSRCTQRLIFTANAPFLTLPLNSYLTCNTSENPHSEWAQTIP